MLQSYKSPFWFVAIWAIVGIGLIRILISRRQTSGTNRQLHKTSANRLLFPTICGKLSVGNVENVLFVVLTFVYPKPINLCREQREVEPRRAEGRRINIRSQFNSSRLINGKTTVLWVKTVNRFFIFICFVLLHGVVLYMRVLPCRDNQPIVVFSPAITFNNLQLKSSN
jgi:hypothetical protein